jgi:hypothetical protein
MCFILRRFVKSTTDLTQVFLHQPACRCSYDSPHSEVPEIEALWASWY